MDKSEFAYQGIAADQMKNVPPPSYSAAVNVNQFSHGNYMGRRSLADPPGAFYVKKWILLVTMFFNMSGLLVGFFCTDYIVQVVIDRSVATGQMSSAAFDDPEIKRTITTISYIVLTVCLALEVLFFYGVAKHHLGLTTGYTVLSILGTFSMLMGCVVNPAKLLDTVVFACIAYVSYSFMKDLRKMRDNRIRMGLDVI